MLMPLLFFLRYFDGYVTHNKYMSRHTAYADDAADAAMPCHALADYYRFHAFSCFYAADTPC